MPSDRGRRAAVRAAAAALVSAVAAVGLLGSAGPAAADGSTQTRGGATAVMGELKTYGTAVLHEGGEDREVPAGLYEMSVDGGGTLQTYCVDLHSPTQRDAVYHETAWSGSSLGTDKDAGRINWILRHSYPQVNDLAALAEKAGIHGALTEQDAAAGTQVAIWRYSDGADVDAADPQAEQLADYLRRSARNTPEPKASLALDPPAVSGRPGSRLGPVTVHTGADTATVTPPAEAAASGVRIVDKDGRPVTSVRNGSRLFFDVPEDAADGSAELTVQASTTVPVGRALVSESRSQTQILAGSSESTVSAVADAAWAGQGAVAALSARRNCAEGGVDITAVNAGDVPFTFTLMGAEHTVPAGASRTVTIPLPEDQAYDLPITGPGGSGRRFTGVFDCRTQDSASDMTVQTVAEPSPATAVAADTGTDLADTGGSAATPLIAGSAIGLVVIGGAALLIAGRKNPPTRR
ncbi:Cys-Gln thioester bond-forming surface protein [Streptomyces sp. MS06]|uniref:Cys-Gln thioester bond-forming surface protein n=1 Tax=Streptomyces sp. MS06 TaxID=3385974 RepID=UPI0039A23CE7